jgi:hypothetical protein
MPVTRRNFLHLAPVALAPLTLGLGSAPALATEASAPSPTPTFLAPPDPSFPAHPAALAREMVIAAHGHLARVNELLGRWPTLANAAIDWGFGDWEDALGAASHVGNREIARVLLASGARPTLFSAAMLGQLDAVRAFLSAAPALAATPGPHGIPLLRHAVAGGPESQAVVDFLSSLPETGAGPEPPAISAEELKSLAGTYSFGLDYNDKLVVELKGTQLTISRAGRSTRGLVPVASGVFFPAGAPEVRIRFGERRGKAIVTVFDPDPVVIAEKVS